MTLKLDGERAFHTLREILEGRRDPKEVDLSAHPPLERLRLALLEGGCSSLDLAVLLRHVLRFQSAQRNDGFAAKLRTPNRSGWPDGDHWKHVGIQAAVTGSSWELQAVPWTPSWLQCGSVQSVDGTAVSELVRRPLQGEGIPGDRLLESIGFRGYQSSGQRCAIRSALSMPEGATLLVCLPTGEGKSLVFELIEAVGFGDSENAGVTLVVVPTITLALDHEHSVNRRRTKGFPRAYLGGADNWERNRSILERIEVGEQGLCFASPEAVCGSMRKSLRTAAQRGRLRAIVVDEAHLIESWGTGFRTEFQILSGVRQELLSACPEGLCFRTVLLSATVTQTTFDTLDVLFSEPGPFGFISALTVRPEIEFWVGAYTDPGERERRVVEALLHLPRPAILYVTKVLDAEEWRKRLRGEGFRRLAVVHGDTGPSERERILKQWHDGQLDLIVGTSAFGLGVDYAHVRSILHACIPETLDRFYQEVGRGGRDGKACISLILPIFGDMPIAERINREMVISIDRGFQRWKSMFEHGDCLFLGQNRFAVRLDVPPGHDERDIDMHGKLSTEWNARTLTLMARCGLIRLLGVPSEKEKGEALRDGVFQIVEIVEPELHDYACWQTRMNALRQNIARSNEKSLESMRRFLNCTDCPAKLITEMYRVRAGSTLHTVSHDCGGCPIERKPEGCDRRNPQRAPECQWPWSATPSVSDILRSELDEEGRLVIYYSQQQMTRAWYRRLGEMLHALYRHGVRKLIILGNGFPENDRALAFAEKRPMFLSRPPSLAASTLPPGPEAIFISPGYPLEMSHFAPRPAGSERVFFVSDQTEDPGRPGIRFRETYHGRERGFDEFHRRLTQ